MTYPYSGREGDYYDGYESDDRIAAEEWADYLIETGRAYQ